MDGWSDDIKFYLIAFISCVLLRGYVPYDKVKLGIKGVRRVAQEVLVAP